MEHAKKMFLVDSRFDLRNKSHHHSDLNQAITSVLSADLPERKKQLQYEQALHRYQTNLPNIESAASEPIKVQLTAEEKSVKDKIIEAVGTEDKAKALQVYDDLSAYTPLTVGKLWLIHNGTIITDFNLVDLIVNDGCATIKVTKENESSIRERMYGKEVHCTSTTKFKVGDKVCISKTRRTFNKIIYQIRQKKYSP